MTSDSVNHAVRCAGCLFCHKVTAQFVLCTNADVAQETGWEGVYVTQGYLEMPLVSLEEDSCFWYVPNR